MSIYDPKNRASIYVKDHTMTEDEIHNQISDLQDKIERLQEEIKELYYMLHSDGK